MRTDALTPPRTRGLMAAATVAVLATVAAAFALAAGGERAQPPSRTDAGASQELPALIARRVTSAGAEPSPVARLGDLATAARPGALPPAEDAPPSEPLARAARPGSERALYESFLAEAGQPDGRLVAHASELFGPDHADAERVALLRALWDGGSPAAGAWFAHALRLPAESSARVTGLVSLPEFAVGFLAGRAGQGASQALTLLSECALAPEAGSAVRRRAAEAVASHGTPAQVAALAGQLVAAREQELLAALSEACRDGRNAAAVASYFPAPLDRSVTIDPAAAER
jgi:hypothetical protein